MQIHELYTFCLWCLGRSDLLWKFPAVALYTFCDPGWRSSEAGCSHADLWPRGQPHTSWSNSEGRKEKHECVSSILKMFELILPGHKKSIPVRLRSEELSSRLCQSAPRLNLRWPGLGWRRSCPPSPPMPAADGRSSHRRRLWLPSRSVSSRL